MGTCIGIALCTSPVVTLVVLLPYGAGVVEVTRLVTLNEIVGFGMRFDIRKELAALCSRNRDGSYSTQANRVAILQLCGKQLQKAGFQNLAATSLKPKHVEALLATWREQGISVATQKNRMAAVRWWAEKVHRQNCVPRTNGELGISRRVYVPEETRAWRLSDESLKGLGERMEVVLQLQQEFGLRREEALKFRPSEADRGAVIALKGSWCKGGRPRDVPVRNEAQKAVLEAAHRLAGKGSMIAPDKSYKEGLEQYKAAVDAAGLSKCHGLRHGYAQVRYQELTGWAAPLAGGPARADLNEAQLRLDHEARMVVSAELGHGREEITVRYLGR